MTVRELQHLAAAMAHEVRNPLNSMAIHVELLEGRLRREQGSEAALKSVTMLAQEIQRVDRILDDYLAWAGPSEAPRQSIDPRALIAEAARRAQTLAEQRRVAVETRTRGELGHWQVDGEGLAEAIDLIIDRALQSSPPGSVVYLAARTDDDLAEVMVTDQSGAISDDEIGRLFHIGLSGHGVGLTVAKQIIKGHGGSITAKRASPSGIIFTIRFPLEGEP
jgi:signal transduction histidine kinase